MTLVSSSFSNEAMFHFRIIAKKEVKPIVQQLTANIKNIADLYFIIVKFTNLL